MDRMPDIGIPFNFEIWRYRMKIKALSEGQIEKIQKLTEEMIENVGFKVEHKGLLKIAVKAGAKVDEASQIVKIPAQILRELLSLVPKSYIDKGIDGKEYHIGGGKQYISAIVTDPWIIDYKTREPRRPNLGDMLTNTILTQKNDQVAVVGRMDFPVTDYSDATSTWRALETHLLNHTKHYNVYTGCLEDIRRWMEIGHILTQGADLAGSKLMTVAVAIVSPLTLPNFNCEVLLETTANHFAVIPTICPMAGMTSPYSKDTTLLQGNVENIFLAALTQMIHPGNPFIYTFGPSVSNMRTGHDLYYTMDKILWKIATAELAQAYHMPTSAEAGGTLGHRYDMQSGAESMLFMVTAQNTGSDLLAGLGSCYNANGLSSEMILIESAWLEAAQYLSRGLSTEYLEEGVASITEQGPGGNFLIDDLTMKLLRSDEFFPGHLFDNSGGYEPAPSILDNAHRKVEELTADFKSPVPEKIQEDLRRYFHDLYKKIGG
jgi:trimethylamine--corrinoid protein Co-methyltransferase